MLPFVLALLSNILYIFKRFLVLILLTKTRQEIWLRVKIPYNCRAYALPVWLIPCNRHSPHRYIIHSMHQKTPILWCKWTKKCDQRLWTFFQNFFFLYTGIFKSLPLQNHSIGNHPKWDLTTLGVFFLWLWRPLPVNQNIVGTKELCFISNQTLVERTKNIHRFFIRNELLKKAFYR